MKILLKQIRLLYLIISFTILFLVGIITWPIRKFLQWLYLIDEDYILKAPMSSFIELKIRQNKRINLDWLHRVNGMVIEWFNLKIN